MLGYGVFCSAAILLTAELLGRAAVGTYHGLFQTVASIAENLPSPRGGHRIFSLRSPLDEDVFSASSAYDGRPWAEEFWKERKESFVDWDYRYEPFRVWGNSPFHGKYINVDETESGVWRRTVNFCGDGQKRKKKLWVLGESTAFGAETPDSATLPSYLSQKINAAGKACVEVSNFGVPSYVLNQKAILLIQLLKAGHRPDTVVFYDGDNDAEVGAYSPGLPGAHAYLMQIKAKFESTVDSQGLLEKSYAFRAVRGMMRRLRPANLVAVTEEGKAVPMELSDEKLAEKAKATLDNYEANIRLIAALGRAYGFKPYFFWEPVLAYGSRNKNPLEEILNTHPLFASRDENRAVAAVYREAERRASLKNNFYFLGHIFDPVRDPIYVDTVHVGPRGNEIVAEAMARIVR